MIEVYADYHTPTVLYAKDSGDWFLLPSTPDGWQRRRPWRPTPLLERRISSDTNRMTFYGQAWLAEVALGIPRDRVAVVKTW